MSEISKTYEPQAVEAKWYQFWLDENCFVADPARVSAQRPAYSIVIPPPNVTGMLTLGHVLNNTIQDILARKARMDGKEVLWLPGTDHAGIATQTVVEKALRKQGLMKHRDDLGREQFLEHVWAWKEKHGGIILQQLRALGASCDWSRTRFTMDPEYSRCVQKVFVELYKKGLIYRGKRMVNWDPAARTALSDEEVEMTETKGHLWHLKYPLLDDAGRPVSDQFVIVATTRPETMLGDEAVAVNPQDPRYTNLVGRKVLLPLQNKSIPIIADDFVDPKFGTGCVKVTPAHDPNDFQMAARHQLPLTEVIGPDGVMTALAGDGFAGLDRFKAREAVVAKLTELGLLLKVEDYVHNVGYSQRTNVPIEPYLSEQWFLKYPCVEPAIACVAGSATVPVAAAGVSPDASGEDGSGGTTKPAGETPAVPPMRFHPDRWTKTYTHWMANIKDWCISRQLWWGHRIPVWTLPLHVAAESVMQHLQDYFGEWGVGAGVFIEIEKAEPGFGDSIRFLTASDKADQAAGKLNAFYQSGHFDVSLQEGYPTPRAKDLAKAIMAGPAAGQAAQDPDVLDTWFSSWLWPFATMGWPENTETLKKFYPTTDLVTGPDIIFFWVARMIMAGYEFMGELPFRNVYFTGIIRDKQGRKMSKSLGNSPDPLDLIGKFGADALRFGTMRSAPLGQDILFDEQNVELGRNFCNKLWNACRFRQMQGGATEAEIDPARLTSDDRWILLRLDAVIRDLAAALADYKFSDAAAALYRFFWSEYCDWFVEASKATLARSVEALNRESVKPGDGSTVQPVNDPAGEAQRANKLAVIDFVLSNTLRLMHPFLPFITEDLWHGLGYNADLPADQGGRTIMLARWPKPFSSDEKAHYGLDETAAALAAAKYELITKGRNWRREFNLPAGKKLTFILKPAGDLPSHEVEVIRLLLNAEAVTLDPAYVAPKGTPSALSPLGELFLPLAGVVDVAAEQARLTKEIVKSVGEIEKVQAKLSNADFVRKVPPAVLAEHQARLADWQAKKQHADNALAALIAI